MRKTIVVVVALACGGVFASPASASTTTECTTTLAGSYDRISVPAGATCTLDGATVTSNVSVDAGGSLFTTNATIGGNVMSRNAATVRLIDTNIDHSITVTGTTGTVKIGSSGCKVDPAAAGNVMLKSNLGSIAICDVAIGHNLALMDNAGRIGVFRNTVGNNGLLLRNTGLANRVRDNTLDQNLNCKGNTNKVIASGNTAHKLMGQCTS